jgi:RHS repeat-associated protein
VAAQEASRPDRGVMPNGSYSISDIENINVLNGNVNIRLPLASLPPIAGGKLSWTITAQYNSKVWDVTRYQQNDDPMSWQPYTVNTPGAGGGWTIGRTYTIFFRNANEDFERLFYPANSGVPQWDRDLMNDNQWWKVVLRMPDGSEHEFRPTDFSSSSYNGGQDFLRGFYKVIPNGSPMRYYSVDGTYMFARITSTQDWTVYLPDGTQIIQTSDGVQRIQDPNGNKIKIFSDLNGNQTHYQDEQTGRELRLTYNSAGQGQYQVWYNTVTGAQEHIDVNLATTTVDGKLYSVASPECASGLAQVLYAQLTVVHEIVFPQTEPGQQQRRFTFTYNSDSSTTATDNATFSCPGTPEPYTRAVSNGLGELSRMVTPSGSIVDYSYNYDGVTNFAPFGIGDYLSQDTITQKKITHDGTTDTWTYDASDSFGSVTGPDGSVSSEAAFCSMPNTPGCATDKAGLTYRSVRPFTKIERHWINLAFSGADNLAPNGVVPLNPVVDAEYTTLTDAAGTALRMSAKTFQYDYNGNVTQTKEYDWFDPAVQRDANGVPTGVPPGLTPLRTTDNSYYNAAPSDISANVYAKRSVSTGAPLILNALQQTTVGAGVVQLSYDGQLYGVAPTAGNLTAKKVWDDVDSKWITTGTTYDLYGNVKTIKDGRQKETKFFYDDATHALPTRVDVDPQNGTGIQTTLTEYDYSTGLVTRQIDVNQQESTIDYTNQLLGTVDPFGRPGITKAPTVNINGTNHQRRVTTTYLDSTRQVIVATDLNAENDKLLKTRTTTDQLGRPVLTEQTEDGTNYTISVRNAYLDMGRVTLTSSAMRSTTASTDSWTRVTKDTAGRIKEVATFAGATQPVWNGTTGVFTGAVTTDYDAEFTTVTDQAGKVRRSKVDGLGRLLRVDEPDANGNLGPTANPVQPTDYQYDVFDNLKKVTQGAQVRNFTYDSLSRLRTAVNPESGTVSYQYDDNSNLLVKTDARGVSTHFEYDSLNRVTRRWYNSSSSVTATLHNNPTLPVSVGATDEVRFYYDTQALPSGAPSYLRGFAVGRLVAQVYGSGSNGDYYAYDVLGRQTLKYQQTGTVNYQLSASYSLSGALKTIVYPSGHTVTNEYDNSGRLTTFSGNLGDGATRTYASDILYSPVGGLVKEQFGTATPVYNKLFYNSRGQLAEIRVSTSYTGPTDTTWNRGAIINHYSNQCWGMCSGSSMTDNNGNLQKQEVYIPSDDQVSSYTMRWQQYDYDSLNRLNSAREVKDNIEKWKQQFTYDRWGNRTINNAVTYGIGVNNKAFAVAPCNSPSDPCSNRLLVPSGQSGVMTYDAAGNLTNDTYTGAGTRTYDAENKITSAWGGNNQAQLYGYDASGQRIKRTVDGVATWQVYGLGGELVAEYPANGAAASPQKEYGYRNGQLLITAAPATTTGPPPTAGLAGYWKFDENSGTTTADSSGNNNPGTLTSGATWATGQNGAATSFDGADDYVQMGAPSSLVMTNATTLSAWIYPTGPGSMVTYGGIILCKEGEYEITRATDGTIQWAFANTNPGWNWINTGAVTPLNQWTHIAVTYDNGVIKTYLNGTLAHTYSGSGSIGDVLTAQNDFRVGGRQAVSQNFQGRVDEARAYNRALSAGEVATLQTATPAGLAGYWKFDENSGTTAADSSGNNNTGTLTSGATWATGQSGTATTLDGVDDYVQVGAKASLVMTSTATFSAWIYPTGPGSLNPEGGVILNKEGEYELARFADGTIQLAFANTNPGWNWINTGYVAPLNQWTHVAVTYDNGVVKTYANGTLAHTYSGSGSIGDILTSQNDFRIGGRQGVAQNFQGRIDEVRVYNRALSPTEVATLPSGLSSGGAQIQWLITDHLGTPRMILDQSGALANVLRHDYLPFGEELFTPTGGRSAAQGYTSGDGVRQQFTFKERDNETGLDYFLARYYSSMQGRFTSVDPQNIVFEKERGRNARERGRILQNYLVQPQNWNRYAYTRNNPLAYTDPNGRCSAPSGLSKGNVGICIEAFIATARIGSGAIQGLGDNRTFAANDPTKTNRIELRGTITPGRDASGWSYDLQGKANVSKAIAGGVVELSREGTLNLEIKTTSIDKDGNAHLAITMTGVNGFSGFPGAPAGAITLNVNLVVTPDGKVGVEGGERTAYPSVGIYAYTVGSNGQPRAATLGEGNETTIDALTKPTVPIQPVAPTCNCEKKPEDR